MSNNDFKNEFLNNRSYVPASISIISTNEIRNDEDVDYICYVEGPTDEDFYGNLNVWPFSNKKVRFISGLVNGDATSEQKIGKESVISSYYKVFSHSNFKELLYKSIFIVDSDNYGLLSEYYEEEYLNKDVFNVTKGYAFENYFFLNNNIKRIFEYFNLSYDEYEKFNKYLEKFVQDVSYFTRLKSCTTIACKKCKYQTYLPSTSVEFLYGNKAGEKIEFNDIFNFDFTGKYNYYFRKNLMDRQIKKIEQVIRNYDVIMDYFNNVSIKYENNVNYIRGHDVYNFLQAYFKQNFNINISPKITDRSNYLEILNILELHINFVNGLGEVIE